MYRRQLLLASTSLPLKPQQMMASMTPPPSLTDYHKLATAVQEAEKLKKTSYGSPEINDVVCWLSSSDPLKHPNIYKSPDELSGMIAVPPAQEVHHEINEKEVVTARVRRPAALKLMKNKEEQLVLQGIEVTNDKPLCFDVYIKLGAEEKDDEEELYVGTFSHMPPPPRSKQGGRHNNKQDFDGRKEQKRARRCCLRLGMNDMLSHLPESVIVKLVPTFKLADDPIKVASIFIDHT